MFNYKFLFGLFLVIFLFNVSTKVEAQEASVSSRQIDEIIVTSRTLNKKFTNYEYLKIKKKINFEKLNTNNKRDIRHILKKYNPKKIFYFSGQSSIPKSIKLKKATFSSHYIGTKNFLDILKKEKSDTKFFKANSGYIFSPKKGLINLDCKYSTNKNPY